MAFALRNTVSRCMATPDDMYSLEPTAASSDTNAGQMSRKVVSIDTIPSYRADCIADALAHIVIEDASEELEVNQCPTVVNHSYRIRGEIIDLSRQDIEGIATGCQEDYFTHSADGIRCKWPGTSLMHDPISVMKDGIMVLHHGKEEGFVRKLLRADDELRFLYLLDTKGMQSRVTGTAKIDGLATIAIREEPLPPVFIPMSDVKNIYVSEEAYHICEQYNITLDHCDGQDPYVMLTEPSIDGRHNPLGDIDEETIFRESLYIFLCAPIQRLKECILAAKDFTLGEAQSTCLRVDTVSAQDDQALIDFDATDFKFEITFRGKTEIRTVTLWPESCHRPDLGGIKEKLQEELLPIDFSRVHLVLQDAMHLRRALLMMQVQLFKRGVAHFVRNWDDIGFPVADKAALAEAREWVAREYRVLGSDQHADSDEEGDHQVHVNEVYEEAGTRATFSALMHMLELENDFQLLAQVEQERLLWEKDHPDMVYKGSSDDGHDDEVERKQDAPALEESGDDADLREKTAVSFGGSEAFREKTTVSNVSGVRGNDEMPTCAEAFPDPAVETEAQPRVDKEAKDDWQFSKFVIQPPPEDKRGGEGFLACTGAACAGAACGSTPRGKGCNLQ